MKKLILLAALAVSVSIGAITLETTNQSGGKIVLTEKQGICPEGQLLAYGTSPNGNVNTGCWVAMDGRAFVRYDSGDMRVYESSIFTVKGGTNKK